jgi:DNA-binding NarL/FixJ family response regulator
MPDRCWCRGWSASLHRGPVIISWSTRSPPMEDDGRLRLLSVMVEQHLEPLPRPARTPNLDLLSSREREVLALVADGLSNAAIAEELNLSEHTAKRHVANILVKLDLPTRAAAAAMIARQKSP